MDGATRANNPVWQVWDQAQLIWGPSIEDRVEGLKSIGTGIPSLKPFQDDVFHIGTTLLTIVTETERTAEAFQRDKTYLDNASRYYRFNVVRGLEDIGLEESKKKKEIAAVTRRYVESQDVLRQMQAFVKTTWRAENVSPRLSFRAFLSSYRANVSIDSDHEYSGNCDSSYVKPCNSLILYRNSAEERDCLQSLWPPGIDYESKKY